MDKKKTKKRVKRPQKNWKKFWKLGADEFNTQFFGINKDGDLTATEGHNIYNINDLAQKYGTPLQVVFPFIIEDRLKDLIGYFQAYMKIYGYKGKFFYHYPMKVNQNKEFIFPLLSVRLLQSGLSGGMDANGLRVIWDYYAGAFRGLVGIHAGTGRWLLGGRTVHRITG